VVAIRLAVRSKRDANTGEQPFATSSLFGDAVIADRRRSGANFALWELAPSSSWAKTPAQGLHRWTAAAKSDAVLRCKPNPLRQPPTIRWLG
jgi:hypothetical protein